jgi:hypothetical protein
VTLGTRKRKRIGYDDVAAASVPSLNLEDGVRKVARRHGAGEEDGEEDSEEDEEVPMLDFD